MASDGYALRFDGVQYTAAQERLLASVLAMPASSSRARAGIRPGSGMGVTVGGTPEAAMVAPGSGIITDTGAGAGSYLFVIPSAVARNLATRPAAGQSRLDEVVALIKNGDERVGDGVGVHEIDIALLTGTASAGTPTAPTIPAGQLRLNELVVPASGSVTVQKPAQRTVALGGILPVASQAELDAIEVIYDSLIAFREDTDRWQGRSNGAWETLVTDKGWVNLSLTGVSGWTVDVARYRLTWPRVELDIQLTRTGATITGDSAGNCSAAISTGGFPTAIRPADTTNGINLRGSRPNTYAAGFNLTDTALSLQWVAPGGNISSGVQLWLRDSYVLG